LSTRYTKKDFQITLNIKVINHDENSIATLSGPVTMILSHFCSPLWMLSRRV